MMQLSGVPPEHYGAEPDFVWPYSFTCLAALMARAEMSVLCMCVLNKAVTVW